MLFKLSLAMLLLAQADLPTGESHTLRSMEPEVALAGEMLVMHTRSKQAFMVYATGAADAERGLLLLHEWWGLTRPLMQEADYWAAQGYRVYAPDLYDGFVASTSREAARAMHAVNQSMANSKMKAVLEALAGEGKAVVAMGWCFGGGQALQAGIAAADQVKAVAIYYGRPELRVARLRRLAGPVLGIWANGDGWITPQRVDEFARALDKAGRDFEFHDFDAGHAFANPSGDHYDSALARQARQLTSQFFDRALGGHGEAGGAGQ